MVVKTVPGGKLTFSNYGWDSTDVTLADEDTNADYANRAIQRNIAMQVAPYGGKISNRWKWPQLVAKFACRTDTCMFWHVENWEGLQAGGGSTSVHKEQL